jgi:hypothetical protein
MKQRIQEICRTQKCSINEAKQQTEAPIISDEILWEAVRRFKALASNVSKSNAMMAEQDCHSFLAKIAKEYADKFYQEEQLSESDASLYILMPDDSSKFHFFVQTMDLYIAGM